MVTDRVAVMSVQAILLLMAAAGKEHLQMDFT